MHIIALQHVRFETPALIQPLLESLGHTVEVRMAWEVEQWPEPDSCEALVLMGGPMNVYQYRDHPWLRRERVFLERALNAGIPVFGICLGAQLIADALGARVVQAPLREIGWHPIRFSREARDQIRFLPESLDVFHWHGDAVELPRGATRLASSAGCTEQGFLYANRVVALQFHLECDQAAVERLLEHCADEIAEPETLVQTADMIRSLTSQHLEANEELLRRLLNWWSGPVLRVV